MVPPASVAFLVPILFAASSLAVPQSACSPGTYLGSDGSCHGVRISIILYFYSPIHSTDF